MDTRLLLYALGAWFVMLILAIINAIVRNKVYQPAVGEHAGHVISTIIAIFLFISAIYLFLANINISYTKIDLILIGVFWLLLTVVFEFLFGHYVMGNSWEKLLTDYNILEGRLWSLVLLTELIGPYIIGSLLKKVP